MKHNQHSENPQKVTVSKSESFLHPQQKQDTQEATEICKLDNTLWKLVIMKKMKIDGHWTTKTATRSHGVKIWKDIRKLREIIAETIGLVVEGRKIHFWLDIRMGRNS